MKRRLVAVAASGGLGLTTLVGFNIAAGSAAATITEPTLSVSAACYDTTTGFVSLTFSATNVSTAGKYHLLGDTSNGNIDVYSDDFTSTDGSPSGTVALKNGDTASIPARPFTLDVELGTTDGQQSNVLVEQVSDCSVPPVTKTVHVKSSSLDQSCPSGQVATSGQLNLTQIVPDQPATISVTRANPSATGDAIVYKTAGKTAQYLVLLQPGQTITDATAVVPSNWTGEFVLSHYGCSNPTPPVCNSSKKDSDGSSLAWYSRVAFKIGTTAYDSYMAALTAATPGNSITATGTADIPAGCTSNPFNALYQQLGATLQTQVLLDHDTSSLVGTGESQPFSATITLPTSGTGEGQLCGSVVLQGDSGVGVVITDFHNGTYGPRKFANGYTGLITKDFGSCEQPPTSVTATTPTFNDACGTANDTYTILSTTGVEYKVDGMVKTAGTYPGSGTVNITANAESGYTLTGPGSWSFTFTNTSCGTYTPPPVVYTFSPYAVLHSQCTPGTALGEVTGRVQDNGNGAGSIDLTVGGHGGPIALNPGDVQELDLTGLAPGTVVIASYYDSSGTEVVLAETTVPTACSTPSPTGTTVTPAPSATPSTFTTAPSPNPSASGPQRKTDVVATASVVKHHSTLTLEELFIAALVMIIAYVGIEAAPKLIARGKHQG